MEDDKNCNNLIVNLIRKNNQTNYANVLNVLNVLSYLKTI
jgi:hypothetical protein